MSDLEIALLECYIELRQERIRFEKEFAAMVSSDISQEDSIPYKKPSQQLLP